MPKLDVERKLARARHIEDAALPLFVARGFHGVGLREIASRARVSLGNVYNHFPGKELIFTGLMKRLARAYALDMAPLVELVEKKRFPRDLVAIGEAIGKLVERNRDYLTLVYVDMAELGGVHSRPHYENLASKFAKRMKPAFESLKKERVLPAGIDPAVAFTVVYMQFANYFIIERRIGGRHLGLDDKEAISAIAKILSKGLLAGGTR